MSYTSINPYEGFGTCTMIEIKKFLIVHKSVKALVISIFILTKVNGQVYNYFPIEFTDFEVNPSVLMSPFLNPSSQYAYSNTFSKIKPLSIIRVSTNQKMKYFGYGITVNAFMMENKMEYDYASLGCGFKHIKFKNKHILIGGTYKLMKSNIQTGSFDYYKSTVLGSKVTINQNFNFAITYSDTVNRFYFSANFLNMSAPFLTGSQPLQFPTYYVLQMGNFLNFLKKKSRSEVSFVGIGKISPINGKFTYSEYFNFGTLINISSNSGFQLGSRIGLGDNDYFHIIPYLNYNIYGRLSIKLSHSFHRNKLNFDPIFVPSTQFSILFQAIPKYK